MPIGPLGGVILIKTERMRGVEVDGDTAHVAAGVLASELGEAAHEHGRLGTT
jgi:FAD/FMN-containing dehydrogenase